MLCPQVPLHTLHTAAWNWPQPNRVWPERWTSPDAAGAPKNGAGTEGLASAFLPWGASCPSHAVSEVQVRGLLPGMAWERPVPACIEVHCLKRQPQG